LIRLSLAALALYLMWLVVFRLSLSAERYQHLSHRCWGHWWELLLYQDYPHSLLKALGDLLARTAVLLGWMAIPLMLWSLLAWPLGKWLYASQSFRLPRPDEAFLVSMNCPQPPQLRCEGPLQLEGAPLRSATDGFTYWRLRGRGTLAIQSGSQELRLAVPGNPGSSSGPLRIHYPYREWWLGDFPCPWEVLLILHALAWAGLIALLRRLF